MENKQELTLFAQKAEKEYLLNNISATRSYLMKMFISVVNNPEQLKYVNNFNQLGKLFHLMLNWDICEEGDSDSLIIVSSLAYLFTSKTILNEPHNVIAFRNRVLLLNADEPFNRIIRDAFKLDKHGPLYSSLRNTPLIARDIIYKMEIADIELHPIIYREEEVIRLRKDYFDKKIREGHFLPDKNKEDIIISGLNAHKTVTAFLEDKMINKNDIIF